MPKSLQQSLTYSSIKKRDESLIKSILRGKKSDFSKLMSLYKKRIFIFGKSFFHNDTDADDFVQDVFLKAYTHLDSFRGKSLFSTWLMKIAWTTAVNSVNRKKEYVSMAENMEIADADFTPEEREIKNITQAAIRQAILELPEKYAICIDMYFSYDISYKDISEITGFPENTVKSHIFRAKKLLRSKLEDFYAN